MAAALAEAERIQAEMRQVRSELRQDVQEVVASAREMADWRQYVRSSPWISLGIAAAVGYVLVPPRTIVVRPAAEDLVELAKAHRVAVNTSASARPSIWGGVSRMALGWLVQGGMALASQQLDQYLQQRRRSQNGSDHAPRGEHHV